MNARRLAGGAALVAMTAGNVLAQRVDEARAGVASAPGSQRDTAAIGVDLRSLPGNPLLPEAWRHSKRKYAPAVSVIVPGSGQLLLGNDRFIAYASVEFLSWWKYVKDVRDQANGEAEFKDIARRVARFGTGPNPPDGPWSYYEAMRDFLESGRYSMSGAGLPVVPDTDATTYNGQRWLLELQTHKTLADALAAYQQSAIKPQFAWSWRNAQLQYDLFKRATSKRNDAYQAGIQDLTVIGMNHLLSMVDAFATLRLQVRHETNGATSIGASLPW